MGITTTVNPGASTGQPPLPGGPCCLFLDVDGTLVEFALRPEGVCIDEGLIELLRLAEERVEGVLALVSGRPISQLDRLFAPLELPAAGVHGGERRDASKHTHREPVDDERLRPARDALRAFVTAYEGLLFEDKGAALALHYRLVPHLREEVRTTLFQLRQSLLPDYDLLDGNLVFELKSPGFNKAAAIEAFMAEDPFKGRLPVFLGDDTTDSDGFAAVTRRRGLAIAVGERVLAPWRLPDPHAVREWLREFVRSRDPNR